VGDATPKLTVYTIAFQTFVFMQLFNQINARKLGKPSDPSKGLAAVEEYNVFSGFFNNWLFLIITFGTFALQIIIVYFGGKFLRVVPLSIGQNLFALGMGFFMLPWTLIVKKIPSRWFSGCKLND
jgi:Ca2+ transporting ATPase